jgi:DNA-binding phage protein
MAASDPIEKPLEALSLDPQNTIVVEKIYQDPKSVPVNEVKTALVRAQSEIPKYLKEKVNNDVNTTVLIMEYTGMVKFATDNLSNDTRGKYINILKLEVKARGAKDEAFFKLINRFVTSLQPDFADLVPLLSAMIPYISSSDSVFLTVISTLARFKEESHSFLEEQLEILTLEENFLSSFKLLSLLFSIDPLFAAELFKMATLQNLLQKINDNNTTTSLKVIKAALSLLSNACVDSGLRTFIIEKYLDTLVFALKSSNNPDLQTLSGLVILKTWSFETLASKDIKIDDLYDVFTNTLNNDSVEGLSYITLKKSIKIRLRSDETAIFDLFEKLQDKSDENSIKYGVLSIFANLSTIEEKNETSELKKQAQKNLEESIEEDENEIEEFRSDLVERRVIEYMSGLSNSKNISQQCFKILNNLSQVKKLHPEIVKQGGVHLLIKLLTGVDTIEAGSLGLRALSTLLCTSDPNLVFNKDSPKTAFNFIFKILEDDTFTSKDQNTALISLTNLSLLESIGSLSAAQWETIDSFLLNENLFLKRSAIELVSNLMQHKVNLAALFNFENSASKKRFDIVARYTQLEDVRSQSAALAALTFGITIPFICEQIVDNSSIIEYCSTIVNEQGSEVELIERTLFVMYYIAFYSEQTDASALKQIKGDTKLKKNLSKIATQRGKYDTETIEMAHEVLQLVSSN